MIIKETLKVIRNCVQSGSPPGYLYGHQSIAIKNKIYIYGGFFDGSKSLNQNIFILDTATFKWERLVCYSKAYGTAQVYRDNIYFFGGTNGTSHNYLSIYNTSKNLWYEVAKKGDSPKSAYDYLSAVYENKMILFEGKSGSNGNNQQPMIQDMKQIYSINLGINSQIT